MISLPVTQDIPLEIDEFGTIRMRNSRVTLHTVITDFNQGNAPEEIVHSFPTLNVADVYAVISYYLNYQDEIDAYLREEENRAETERLDLEAKHPELFTLQKRLRKKSGSN